MNVSTLSPIHIRANLNVRTVHPFGYSNFERFFIVRGTFSEEDKAEWIDKVEAAILEAHEDYLIPHDGSSSVHWKSVAMDEFSDEAPIFTGLSSDYPVEIRTPKTISRLPSSLQERGVEHAVLALNAVLASLIQPPLEVRVLLVRYGSSLIVDRLTMYYGRERREAEYAANCDEAEALALMLVLERAGTEADEMDNYPYKPTRVIDQPEANLFEEIILQAVQFATSMARDLAQDIFPALSRYDQTVIETLFEQQLRVIDAVPLYDTARPLASEEDFAIYVV